MLDAIFSVFSRDMPGQAVELVERMKCDKKIDFENDWKMITMFVGGNDLCDYCEDKVCPAHSYRSSLSYKM